MRTWDTLQTLRERKTRKPSWLKIRLQSTPDFSRVQEIVRRYKLNTICESGGCPNKQECWGKLGTATFMIMGHACTRCCAFCMVESEKPGPLDPVEPENVAAAVRKLGLKYVVITSVNRDDLPDGGADHFGRTVEAVKRENPPTKVEVLTSDFLGRRESLDRILASGPEVYSHNIETVERLTPLMRSAAKYRRSLEVLRYASAFVPAWKVKSSLMVGVGETFEEIETTLRDLRKNGVAIVHIGQYLQPTPRNAPVAKYYAPEEFDRLKEAALSLGFESVMAGPLVRSSYHAHETSSSS